MRQSVRDRKAYKLPRNRGGYLWYTRWSKVFIIIFNILFSMTLMILSLPIFVIIGLIIKIKDSGPILYAGERMGIKKRRFTMYKFRTLPLGAQKKIGANFVSPREWKLPLFSKFLRDTRLDELPQLFNILICDMDFIGPRPLRPEIYQKMCRHIPDYDLRFSVRPGLIGYSQLFTPHSSPKRVRAFLDNRLVCIKRNFLLELFLIALTILVVLKKTVSMLGYAFWQNIIRIKILKEYIEKRNLDRVSLEDSTVLMFTCEGREVGEGIVLDINEAFFRMETNVELAQNTKYLFKLFTKVKKRGRQKRKLAQCKGEVYRSFKPKNDNYKYAYVIKYEPISQLNQYMIDYYFMDKSMMHLI